MKKRNLSFGAKIILYFNLFSIALMLISGGILTIFSDQMARKALDGKIQSVTKVIEKFSGTPIWNMEYTALEDASVMAMEDPDISCITFFDPQGKKLVSKEAKDAPKKRGFVKRDIIGGDENKKVGTIQVGFNYSRLNEERNKMILMIFAAIVALQTLISTFLFIIVRRLSKPISKVMVSLDDSSTGLEKDSNKLAHSGNSLADSIAKQASSIQEISASLVEISGMLDSNVSSANEMKNDSEMIKGECTGANETMGRLQESMDLISESNARVEKLTTIIQNIKDKTAIMDEIVFQTKLLSFNASVEAERAGEHGRGFAVVAQEVGNLAGLSGKAAQEISMIVGQSINEVGDITLENKQRVEAGIKLVKETSENLVTILKSTEILDKESQSILSSSSEQSLAVKQISEVMSELDGLTQSLAEESHVTRDISVKVHGHTRELNGVVDDLNLVMNGK